LRQRWIPRCCPELTTVPSRLPSARSAGGWGPISRWRSRRAALEPCWRPASPVAWGGQAFRPRWVRIDPSLERPGNGPDELLALSLPQPVESSSRPPTLEALKYETQGDGRRRARDRRPRRLRYRGRRWAHVCPSQAGTRGNRDPAQRSLPVLRCSTRIVSTTSDFTKARKSAISSAATERPRNVLSWSSS